MTAIHRTPDRRNSCPLEVAREGAAWQEDTVKFGRFDFAIMTKPLGRERRVDKAEAHFCLLISPEYTIRPTLTIVPKSRASMKIRN
jgi:hypothetical protein